MLAYRGALAGGKLEQADATAQKLDYLFAQGDAELGADKADPLTTFIASLTILLRDDRKSTRLNSSHLVISYSGFCLKKKQIHRTDAYRVISTPPHSPVSPPA